MLFYGQVLRATTQVGAFSLTSRAVARAIAAPLKDRKGKTLRVLEAGAGMGTLTAAILDELGPGSSLDICEINPAFAGRLRRLFGRRSGVRVLETDIENISPDACYEVIVSSLPLMNFSADKAARIFTLFDRCLAQGGMLSYWDYWQKEFRCRIQHGRERRRMLEILRAEQEFRARYDCSDQIIMWNLPPARVRHVRPRASSFQAFQTIQDGHSTNCSAKGKPA